MADEAAVGSSRLLGTQGAQDAVDTFTRDTTGLAAAIHAATAAFQGIVGSARGMAGGTTSNPNNLGYGYGNGGQISFPGAATGFAGGGSGHYQQIMLNGGGNGGQGGTPAAPNNGAANAGTRSVQIGSATFSDLARYGNRHTSDMVTMDYLGQRYGNPAGMSRNSSIQAQFANRTYGQGANDLAGFNVSVASLSGGPLGSDRWNSVQAGMGAAAIMNRDMSATQIGNAAAGLGSAPTYWAMASMGIQTLGQGGRAMSPGQIAQQIAARSGLSQTKMSAAATSATYDNQNSHLNLNIQNLLSKGIIDADQAKMISGVLRNRQVGINNGLTGAQFDSLSAKAANGDSGALKTLKDHKVDDTALGSLQVQQGKRTTQQAATASDFATGLERATGVVGQLTDAMTNMLHGPLGAFVGQGAGMSSAFGGALGSVGGGVSSIASTIGLASLMRGRGAAGGGGGGGIGGIGSMLGRVGGSGMSAGRAVGIGAGIGIAGNLAGGLIKDGNHGARDRWGSAISGAATGAGIGMLFGPEGAAVGGLLGGAWGAITGAGGVGGDPAGVSTAPGTGTLRSAAEAVKWAVGQASKPSENYAGMCDHFVAMAYGLSHSGYGSATAHWANIPGKFKHTDHSPPVGATVFWNIGTNGHVALSVGGGQIASTDIKVKGKVSIVPLGEIEQKWHARYLGWSPPYYQGRTTSVGGAGVGTAVDNGSVTASSGSALGAGAGTGSTNVGSTSEATNVAAALGALAGGTSSSSSGGTRAASGNGAGATSVSGGSSTPPSKGAMSEAQVKSILMKAGFSGNSLNIGMAVSRAESGWNAGRVGGPNSNGSKDYGLFQFNHDGGPPTWDWGDAQTNAQKAFKLENSSGWTRWSSYNNGAYKKYMKQYKSGAWNIDEDQTAQIHKGEMVLDSHNAQTVRNALLANNGNYGAASGGGAGVTLQFGRGSVVIQVSGSSDEGSMRESAKQFVDFVAKDKRIKLMQAGV